MAHGGARLARGAAATVTIVVRRAAGAGRTAAAGREPHRRRRAHDDNDLEELLDVHKGHMPVTPKTLQRRAFTETSRQCDSEQKAKLLGVSSALPQFAQRVGIRGDPLAVDSIARRRGPEAMALFARQAALGSHSHRRTRPEPRSCPRQCAQFVSETPTARSRELPVEGPRSDLAVERRSRSFTPRREPGPRARGCLP
jgi:hypothetical protein